MSAAWTRPKGDFLLFVPTEYTYVDKEFNHHGDRVNRPRFEMVEISPYMEYGLTDYLTAGMQPKFRYVNVNTSSGHDSNSGLAETDLFARLRLWHQDRAAFSVQGLVKVPIKSDESDPAALGRDQYDAQLSLLYGNAHPLSWGTIFYNLDVGYRKRFKSPADEVHADAFIGWSQQPWTVVLDSSNTIGLNNKKNGTQVLTAEPSFRRHDIQLSGAYQFTDTVSGVVGVSTTYAGRDVGAGTSGFLALSFYF